MFTLATVPAMIIGIGMIFLPESPRWLVSVGQRDRARQVLERVRAPMLPHQSGICAGGRPERLWVAPMGRFR
jgi:hypothetical protein